jgi:hypothetical protein
MAPYQKNGRHILRDFLDVMNMTSQYYEPLADSADSKTNEEIPNEKKLIVIRNKK